MWQNYFFIFRRPKYNVTCFFYKQHQAEIESEIITISSIKRSQNKNKHSNPLYGLPPFLQENLEPPFYDFSKIPTPYK